MSLITLQTTFTKNTSLQVGDNIYFLDTASGSDVIKKIGPVQTIADNYIVCNANGNLSGLTQTSYIFFGKDNSKNTSGVIGYYAEVSLSNNSKDHAELFAVNSEIFISSN
jgi:flagellar basal body rod protein FlgF